MENEIIDESQLIIGWLGAVLTIIQVLGLLFAFIIFLGSSVLYFRKKSQILNAKKNEELKNEEEIKKELEKNKIHYRIAIVISIALFIGSTILSRTYAKPIIYIYPEEKIEVSVKLGNEELIDCSYPKYEDGWRVLASPSGDLVDLKTGRSLYALYWEGGRTKKLDYKEGFIIKREDTAKFLEEKLEILGLNFKEAEEFIVYWLPKMEKNKYNYINFISKEEIDEIMPLEIDPKPDTVIRVYMQFKGLPFPIKVEEQKLEKVERKGYTVVEWGGVEI